MKPKQISEMLNDKAGITLGQLSGVILTFVVIVILASVGGDVLSSLRDDQTTDGAAYNITTDGLTGLDNLSGKFGLLGTIIILAAVIGIVISAFAFGRGGGI